MAAPVYATDLTDILADMAATTGWTALGGGAAGLVAPETDFFVQGSNCISKAGWSTAIKGMIYLAGAGVTVPTTGAVFMWIYYWAPNAMDTSSSGGMRFCCGSSATAYYEYTVAGSDKLPFGGWFLSCVDPNTATADFTVGAPTTTEQSFGATIDVPAGGPSKGQPLGIDAFRYGRGTLTCTNGQAANYATFAGAQAYGDDVARRWGQMSFRDGSYFMSGFLSLGSSGTAVDFRDSNRVIFIRDHVKVASGFNRIEILNAGSNVDWTNISITALGTNSPGTLVHTAGTFDAVLCQFISMGTFSLLSTSVITDSTFRDCGIITAPGSDLRRSSIESPLISANTSPVVWDVATDPDGKLDNMTFTQSATVEHHAIEFGTTSPTTMYLRGITFTDFDTANAANGSVLHIKRTTGDVTIYTVGCSGTVSYKSAGANVIIIADPVTFLVNVKNSSGTNIQNARVFVKASDNTTTLPFEESVTIVNAYPTATVTHTAHGMNTDDKVVISGASHEANNGIFSITYVSANSYTYTLTSNPGSSPTGTIISTFVAISGLTDIDGNISMSRVFLADQPIIGWARKSTAAPFYKTGPIGGSIDSALGLTANVQLILDQ